MSLIDIIKRHNEYSLLKTDLAGTLSNSVKAIIQELEDKALERRIKMFLSDED